MNDSDASGLENTPGTYALVLQSSGLQSVRIGALGSMRVGPGVYVYVGSAFGSGGVRARVQRHARVEETRHWHVDYLRAVTILEEAWYTHDSQRRECAWASVPS